MPLAVQTVFAFAAMASLVGLGHALRRVLRIDTGGAGLDFALAFAALSFVGTLVAALGLLTWPVAKVIAQLVGVGGLTALWAQRRRVFGDVSRTELGATAALALMCAPSLFMAAAPPVARDALVYHLPIARRILDSGGLGVPVGDVYGFFPAGAEIVHALAMALLGERAPATIHLLTGVAAAWMLFDVLRSRAGDLPAFIVAASFASAPVGIVFAGTSYVDLTLCMALAAAMSLIDAFSDNSRVRDLAVAGVFAGLAVSIKYTALLYVGLLALPILLTARSKRPREVACALAVYASSALICASPFLLRNALSVGNPVFPFAYEIFGGPGWDAERARSFDMFLHGYGAGYSIPSLVALPFRLSLTGRFGSTWYDGVIGPAAMLLFVGALVAAIRRSKFHTPGFGVVALAACCSYLFGSHQARFALPVLALLAPVAASGLRDLIDMRARAKAVVAGATVLALLGNAALTAREFARLNPFAASISSEAAAEYQGRRIPGWKIYLHLNSQATGGDRVLCAMTGNFRDLLRVPHDVDAIFEDHTIRQVLDGAKSPGDVRDAFAKRGWTYFFFDVRALDKALDGPARNLLVEFLLQFGKLAAQDGNFLLYHFEPNPI
ncbi:MAG: glycosyltransferase family 39 protein [Deltaproteobacteria bacterium]|nr:glycosyltransferase family 39 protein [Deltaproteobacteria bacterium]